jgi:hypothetical protein
MLVSNRMATTPRRPPRQLDPAEAGLGHQDRDPRLEGGRKISATSPDWNRDTSRLSRCGDLLRRRVRAHDDLLLRLVQAVEGVEELFLAPLAARQEVDVVDHQHVDIPEPVAELAHLVVLHALHEVVDELVARDVVQTASGRPP